MLWIYQYRMVFVFTFSIVKTSIDYKSDNCFFGRRIIHTDTSRIALHGNFEIIIF